LIVEAARRRELAMIAIGQPGIQYVPQRMIETEGGFVIGSIFMTAPFSLNKRL